MMGEAVIELIYDHETLTMDESLLLTLLKYCVCVGGGKTVCVLGEDMGQLQFCFNN